MRVREFYHCLLNKLMEFQIQQKAAKLDKLRAKLDKEEILLQNILTKYKKSGQKQLIINNRNLSSC